MFVKKRVNLNKINDTCFPTVARLQSQSVDGGWTLSGQRLTCDYSKIIDHPSSDYTVTIMFQ